MGTTIAVGATIFDVTRQVWLLGGGVLLVSGCMGRGAAGRAAALPQPTDMATWLAIAVFVIGIWWVALKILRG